MEKIEFAVRVQIAHHNSISDHLSYLALSCHSNCCTCVYALLLLSFSLSMRPGTGTETMALQVPLSLIGVICDTEQWNKHTSISYEIHIHTLSAIGSLMRIGLLICALDR